MPYTLQEIEQYLNELAANIGLVFSTPVKINGRLTTTLGRVRSNPTPFGMYEPECVEFSKRFLETSTDESVRQTIMHEFAHWAVLVETGEPHGHDDEFKAMCRRIGCTADKATVNVERTVSNDQLYKYTVKCGDCGNTIYYNRAGKTVKHPDWYVCGKCGGWSLHVQQNW
jgi:predicted SprT family Zn-dependent metalloprotease